MQRFEPPPLPGQHGASPEPPDPYAAAAPPDPYAAAPQGPYAAAPQAPWGVPATWTHPRGTTVLVLGILSVVLAPVLGPFAWVMGRRALSEADAAPSPPVNRSSLQAGMVLGVIGTVLMVLGALWFLMVMGLFVTTATTTSW